MSKRNIQSTAKQGNTVPLISTTEPQFEINQTVIKSNSCMIWNNQKSQIKQLCNFTLINLVSISPSEASSWCLSTYFWHLDRAFSFGVDTLIALGMIGCMTVSRSKLHVGLWSTHFSPPAECERLCVGWTGGAIWWSQCEKDKPGSYSHVTPAGIIWSRLGLVVMKADHQRG